MDMFSEFMNDESQEEVLDFSVPVTFNSTWLWELSPPSSKPMESWLGDSMVDSSFQADPAHWLGDLMTDKDVNDEETKFSPPSAVPKKKRSKRQCSRLEEPKKSTVKPVVQKPVERKRGKTASLKMLCAPPRKRCVRRPRAKGMGFLPHSTRTEAAGGAIFSKTLTSYDYNRGGILIPRDPATTYVPRGGAMLEDREDGRRYMTEKVIWRNKSPIHVFEHMRAYIKHYNLRPGDQLQFQRSTAGHLIIKRLYATRYCGCP